MDKIEQRIAIAEACGWFGITYGDPDTVFANKLYGERKHHKSHWFEIPDYLNDLNAMHDAEKVLTDGQAYQYRRWIQILAAKYQIKEIYGSVGFDFFATAEQRAEAFLRTIGKWEDET